MKEIKEKLIEFNKYFESGNDVDVNEYVRVSRDEWRELYSLILSECLVFEKIYNDLNIMI